MSGTQQQSATQEALKLKTPGKYNVIFLNDNQTPMEYVVQVLVVLFHHEPDEAKAITLEVHEKGRGVAGTYSYEVAEQKATETITDARRNQFPLDVVIEEA